MDWRRACGEERPAIVSLEAMDNGWDTPCRLSVRWEDMIIY